MNNSHTKEVNAMRKDSSWGTLNSGDTTWPTGGSGTGKDTTWP